MIKINKIIFGSEQFSNGEVSYKPAKLKHDINIIDLYLQDNKSITDLLIAVEFIRDQKPDSNIELYMLYVPYGRMDRPINGYVYSLKMFANIINRCNFDVIYTLDNHSTAIAELIHSVVELKDLLNDYIEEVITFYKPDYLMFPDKGAMKKYPEILEVCRLNRIKYFYGNKERVFDDSRSLKYYEVFDNGLDLKGKRILIIDDICCTGGTVLETATILIKKGAMDIALWVAHCENNVIKYDILRDKSPIKKIYTSNSLVRNYQVTEIEVITF